MRKKRANGGGRGQDEECESWGKVKRERELSERELDSRMGDATDEREGKKERKREREKRGEGGNGKERWMREENREKKAERERGERKREGWRETM
jgi:hypothetical protein